MNNHIPIMPCCPPEAATVVTVQTVDGIKGLNNAFVRVIENNTVYFVDYAHRITPISSNIVEVNNYDVANNPSNFRGQIAFDTSNNDLIYFDYQGRGFGFGRSVSHADLEEIDAKVNLNAQNIILVQSQVNGVAKDVADLKDEVASIDPALIDQRLQEAESTANEALAQAQTAGASVAELGDDVKTLQEQTVQTDTALAGDDSTVTLSKTLEKSGASETTALPLPVASADAAGVMNAATFKAVQENSENVSSILEGAIVLDGLAANITQEQLTEAWKTATGKTELINRASIFDETNGKMWYYYSNTDEWKAIEADKPDVTVSPFTNSTAGIIKGSGNDGQLFAEADSTGSVVGWDALKARVANLEENTPTSVNLLTAYTASPTANDTYSASYVNSRLDSSLIKFGAGAKINSIGACVIGCGAESHSGSVSIGEYARDVGSSAHSNVTIGERTSTVSKNSIILGVGAYSSRNNELSIGSAGHNSGASNPPETRYIANVTAGTLPTDAVNLSQLQGTTLYEGAASTNSITLSATVNQYTRLEISGYVAYNGINYTTTMVHVPNTTARIFQMAESIVPDPTTNMQLRFIDTWNLSEDGMELDLARSATCTQTSNSTAIISNPTSAFVVTKIVGYGK